MRSVYRAAAGGADVSVEDYYRITVYYPTIDNIMKDVELRKMDHGKNKMQFSYQNW